MSVRQNSDIKESFCAEVNTHHTSDKVLVDPYAQFYTPSHCLELRS
ncbi:hypothetical protein SNR37_003624 [Agarivorans aestuarii]|uniref:Uncharacterized protein n=1 Tax=Agarivorans aestuarii TaxID=1563703 RepID=A0ABU7G465_9ALTE|nr:hypothetical protein [Agarivorans aestuarii]MEE1674188.1 hypothetical protein [Agarivorans aestuarii]